MKKIVFCILLLSCSLNHLYAETKRNEAKMKIHSVSIGGEDFFDNLLPQNFYQNFANGKFCRNIYPRFSERKAWENARKSKYANIIIAKADGIKAGEVQQILFSDFRRYPTSGDRTKFEQMYYKRRSDMAYLAIALCLTGDKEKYMPRLLDNLIAILEERTWTLPAHSHWDGKKLLDIQHTDLFCAETGSVLAVLHHILGEELDKEIENISEEIRNKVLERTVYNVLHHPESGKVNIWYITPAPNNWTPWCAYSNIICALLLEKDTEKLSSYVREFLRISARFVSRYSFDGYCEEGPSYYNKAALMVFGTMHLLQKAQPHSMDKLFADKKIRNMLEFIGHMHMSPSHMYSFGDGQPETIPALHLLMPCAEQLKSDMLHKVCSGKEAYLGLCGEHLIACLGLLFDIPENVSDRSVRSASFSYFKDKLAISRTENFTVALKGGSNAESHNHNDLGHFALYCNDMPIIVDAGSGAYKAINFSEHRYSLWYTRGKGHNAPVFNDTEQVFGKQYTAFFETAEQKKMIINLRHAYPEKAGVKTCLRTLDVKSDEVIVNDTVELTKPHTVNITFLTPSQVQILNRKTLKIGNVILECENINFESRKKMPLMEGQKPHPEIPIWRCNLTALHFKTDKNNYRFIFRKTEK